LDPDDWVRQTGQGEVETNIGNAQDFLDFHLEFFQALSLRGATRREYIHNLLREIKEIRDNIFRDELIRILAERLKVNESDLVKVMRGQRSYRETSNENQTAGLKRIEFTSRDERAQIELLQLLVTQNVDIRNMVRTKVTLDMFTHPLLQKLAEQLLTEKMVVDTAAIIEYFTDKLEREIVTEILFSERDTDLPEQIVNDCLKTLKLIPVKKRIMELRINIREKEAQGQNPKTELNEIMKLQQELNDI
jgi:DNA primase